MFIKKQLEYYNSCDVLPLKIFFAIAESGNVNLLSEKRINESILTEAWEDILIEYSELDNNISIKNVFDKTNQIALNIAKYIEVNAMLLYLSEVAYNQDYVNRLKVLGYNVKGNTYIEDIENNQTRVNHIATKIKILQGDIDQFKNSKTKKSSFDQSLAWISANLNFWPPDNITVTRYLELKKQIIERQKK